LNDLTEHLLAEQQSTIQELEHLTRNVEHIKEIVSVQQSYARVAGVVEPIMVAELVEDALRIQLPGYVNRGIEIIRKFQPTQPVLVDRHKVLQILVNLLANARHAVEAAATEPKQVSLTVCAPDSHHVSISVHDNGVGIAPETLTCVFNHGFTTRKDGHGFGLHSGALAAREMGGSLSAHSGGLGHGATFTLVLPVAKQPTGTPPAGADVSVHPPAPDFAVLPSPS
jgi:C4-dicarboxylate-specific signal transduction histidine kinase